MPIDIALKLLEQPLIHDTPYLRFNDVNTQVFELLVPDAQRNDNVGGNYRGTAFKLPTTLEPGRSITSIPPRALPGYVDRNPYAGYVLLEADSEQLNTINGYCREGRYYGDSAFFLLEGCWWSFSTMRSSTEATKLPETHDLYYLWSPHEWLQKTYRKREPIADARYWLAVHGYYGTENKRGKNGIVHTRKITAEAFATLQFLFDGAFEDYTTPRSSYRYITFNDPALCKRTDGLFLYFEVTGRELKLLETVTKRQTESRSYVWFPEGWHMMPTAHGKYAGSIGGEYPYRLAPHSAPTWLPPGAITATGTALRLRGNGITATYEDTDGQPGRWWIRGDRPHDTKSIRVELRRYGCDWDRDKQMWFLTNHRELPDGLKPLLGIASAPEANPPAPATPATAARNNPLSHLFGGDIVRKTLNEDGEISILGVNGLAATRTSFLTIHDEKKPMWRFTIPTDHASDHMDRLRQMQAMFLVSNRTWLYDTEPYMQHMDEFAATVPFNFNPPAPAPATPAPPLDPPATVSANPFRRDNPPAAPHTPFASAHKVVTFELKAPEAPATPPPSLSASPLSPAGLVGDVLAMAGFTAPATAAPTSSKRKAVSRSGKIVQMPGTEEKPPPLVITSAEKLIGSRRNPDLLKQAIARAQRDAAPLEGAPITPGTVVNIPQTYVGELTGAVSGDVHCYGYAVDDGVCVYVNMGGPRTGIEAIRAKLSSAGIVNLTPWDGPAIELTAGEKQHGMYVDFFSNMGERRFYSLILLHRSIVHPIYAEQFTTYVLGINPVQASAKVYQHVQQLVTIPVFPTWRAYLWHAGQNAHLIRRTHCAGGLDVYALNLDQAEWTSLIAGGVQAKTLDLPSTS